MGFMADIAKDLAAAEPAVPAPEPVAASAEPVAEPVAAEPATPAPAAVPPPVADAGDKSPRNVSLARYNEMFRQNKANASALEQANAQIAALTQQAQQSMAAQKPAAAAAADQTADSTGDWIQTMLDAGAELPPELVAGLKALQQKIDGLEKQVGSHGQHFQTAQERQDNVDYDAAFTKLQNRCPHIAADELTEMIVDGMSPQRIVGWYDQYVAPAHAAQKQASAPAPKAAPPPRIDGPDTPGKPSSNDATPWRQWADAQLMTRH